LRIGCPFQPCGTKTGSQLHANFTKGSDRHGGKESTVIQKKNPESVLGQLLSTSGSRSISA
jgi:hypothetical protein